MGLLRSHEEILVRAIDSGFPVDSRRKAFEPV
jgi:hypothetical protein